MKAILLLSFSTSAVAYIGRAGLVSSTAAQRTATQRTAKLRPAALEEQADELQLAGARYTRSVSKSAYTSKDSSWPAFTYAPPNERREAVRQRTASLDTLPPMHIMLLGGPATGKGTIAPMLVQAFCCRQIGVGQLLRSLSRTASSTVRGEQIANAMSRGELLDDDFVIDVLSERLRDSWDVRRNGWVLDGFPKTAAQAEAVVGGASHLRPDCVVALERPTELMKEFMLGRMSDSATGHVYHPQYHPVPEADEELSARLTWRVDDTAEVVARRIETHAEEWDAILEAFTTADVPTLRVDNARSELAAFDEIAQFVEEVAQRKLEGMGGEEAMRQLRSDVDDAPTASSEENTADGLLQACRKLNAYDAARYFPVLVEEAQVGFISREFLDALAPHLTSGTACELVTLAEDKGATASGSSGVGLAAAGAPRKATVGVRLAPEDLSVSARTETVAALVNELVLDGTIPRGKLRNELQDVRPLSAGWVGPDGPLPPLRLERGAMVHFGVPSYGVHVNGFVRNPDDPSDARPWAVWIAKRSMSKATCALHSRLAPQPAALTHGGCQPTPCLLLCLLSRAATRASSTRWWPEGNRRGSPSLRTSGRSARKRRLCLPTSLRGSGPPASCATATPRARASRRRSSRPSMWRCPTA